MKEISSNELAEMLEIPHNEVLAIIKKLPFNYRAEKSFVVSKKDGESILDVILKKNVESYPDYVFSKIMNHPFRMENYVKTIKELIQHYDKNWHELYIQKNLEKVGIKIDLYNRHFDIAKAHKYITRDIFHGNKNYGRYLSKINGLIHEKPATTRFNNVVKGFVRVKIC